MFECYGPFQSPSAKRCGDEGLLQGRFKRMISEMNVELAGMAEEVSFPPGR